MTEIEQSTLHSSCIDYRFAQQVEEQALEDQAHLVAHPGASYDASVVIQTLKKHPGYFGKVVNYDHQQCGVFTNIAKNDSDTNHQKHMDKLRDKVLAINPDIHFSASILPFDEARNKKYQGHHCPATSIILGDPDILISKIINH